jgi:S1-C subfamily serine protease
MDSPDTNPLVAISDSLAAVVDVVGKSTVAVLGRRRGVTSGVVWRPGVLVTVAHAFRRAPAAISLVAEGGRSLDAALIGIDSSTDIAVFRLPDESVAAVQTGDASTVRAGHLAIAIGRGSAGDVTASYGLVNRTGGAWQTWLGGHIDRLIRLDGGVYDGLSGGPVADARGSVIGIATSALSRSYGIVVPTLTVSRVVDALLGKGHVARAFLGISAQTVPLPKTAGEAAAEEDSTVGLLITPLVRGGPADQAGVLIGDILVSVAGQPTPNLHDVRSALADHIGEQVRVNVLRGGVPTELQLTVAEWPTERSCR